MQTFGAHAETPPPNALTGLVFNGIVRLNERTPDGRMIHSGGFGIRALPDGHSLGFKTMFMDGPGGLSNLLVLMHRGMSIAGGTSEIKRNQIGERILGLPRDPLLK